MQVAGTTSSKCKAETLLKSLTYASANDDRSEPSKEIQIRVPIAIVVAFRASGKLLRHRGCPTASPQARIRAIRQRLADLDLLGIPA